VTDQFERGDPLDYRAGQFARFALVGGLGTVTNLVLFFVLVDVAILGTVPPLVGSGICFLVAVSQNYVLNELWTFRWAPDEESPRPSLSLHRYAKFVTASLVGFAINVGVLLALLSASAFSLALIPQAIGILAGMLFNFIASRRVVFRR
jgi:putative flippase GtrA